MSSSRELGVTASRGFGRWLLSNNTSLAVSAYQSNRLLLVGSRQDQSVSLDQQHFPRAMGLAWQSGSLFVACRSRIWRLENVLAPGQTANGDFDALLVPRNAQVTGDVDAHELAIDGEGRVVFVNTSYSCLAALDLRHSFRLLWTPPFISSLAAEDRCHLNGLSLNADGLAAYVTAISSSDVVGGWREQRTDGGVVIDVQRSRIVAKGLSMPHSPRLVGKTLYALESGRGLIVAYDTHSWEREEIAFCPGCLRGMSIVNGHAIVTVSLPREGSFSGLPLESELAIRKGVAWCAVLIVELRSGSVVEWLRFQGVVQELFDVVALRGVRRPMALSADGPDVEQTITFQQRTET